MLAWRRHEEFCRQFRSINRHLDEKTFEISTLVDHLYNEINEWENADRTLNGNSTKVKGTVVVSAATAGQVLGTSSSCILELRWNDRFGLEKTLAESIAQYRLQLGITGTDEEVANQLADIENQIKELEEKRRQIQKETDKWFNKIIPDFPLEGDSEDGVPWRVKTDDYEDQLKQLDGQLSALQDQQSKYHQLMDLQNQYHELDGIILSGIPEDGPTQFSIKNILGGCTNYVAIKRDISGFFVKGHMNANYWNENALAAGFEVGTRPVPGSIMVIKADNGLKNGIMSVDDTAGHVAYVEEITRVENGYKVVISHASTKYDANGNYVAGSYINQNTMTVTVPDGNNSVSFIYEK